MMFRKLGMAAALALATVSTSAVAQSARPLSVANSPAVARSGAQLQGESHYRGGYIIPALILIAIGIGVWRLTRSHSP